MARPTDRLSRRQERKLLKAGRSVFAADFPNPDRIGCPPADTLRAMASLRPAPGNVPYPHEHLTICSPCFVEYCSYVRWTKLRRRARFAVIAATVILTLGAAIWLALGGFGGTSLRRSPEIAQHSTPPPLQPITFDLRSYSISRGEGPPEALPPVLVLPRGRLLVTLLLPVGSAEGEYEVRLEDSEGRRVFSRRDRASILDYNTTLRIEADLREVPSGKYTLRVGRPGFTSQTYPVTIE
jgi:hypothetical protein